MFNFLPIVGTIIDKVSNIIDQTVEDKDLANKIKSQIQLTILTKEYDTIAKDLEAKTKVVLSETTGHSWLQRNWRPITMLVFVYIIAHNFIIAPLFNLKYLPIPPDMWGLLKIGMGGYIFGRTVEKIAPSVKDIFKK